MWAYLDAIMSCINLNVRKLYTFSQEKAANNKKNIIETKKKECHYNEVQYSRNNLI